jgi:radical SAM superfamily enzyme YgiQ (UPF0313 family)
LAASLPDHHQVRAIDMNVEINPYQAIKQVIHGFKPDVICLSIRNIKVAMPGEHISSGLEVAGIVRGIKEIDPDAKLIAGGSGFSLYATAFMKLVPDINCGVVGEGEKVLGDLLEKFPDVGGLPGVVHRRNQKVIHNGQAQQADFEKLPWPRRDLFNMSHYRRYPTSVGVMTKRGCPYRCIHCSDIYLLGKKVRLREPEDVVEELKCLKTDYDVARFMFADQTFNFPGEYTKTLLREMIKADLGMQWTAYFTPQGLDEDMLELFKKSGCQMLSFSPDCCTDAMLRGLRKGFLMEDLHRANRLIKKAQIPVTYNFMLGLPGEKLGSLLRTLLFILKTKVQLKKLFVLHGLFIVPVRIYPHTVLRKLAIQSRQIASNDDLLQARFHHPTRRIVDYADRTLIYGTSLLWKLKHKIIK